MTELRFTSNAPEFKRMLNSLGDKLFKVAREDLIELQERWVRNMKRDRFTGYYDGPTRGSRLRTRTGSLKSSIGGRVTGNKLSNLRALLRVGGGKSGYARIQEHGGTITGQGKCSRSLCAKLLDLPRGLSSLVRLFAARQMAMRRTWGRPLSSTQGVGL